MDNPERIEIAEAMKRLSWYHTIDLGNGICTPGFYDHRQYLSEYGLPKDLQGQTALDIGAASGFFTFELEKRGAEVTSTELPNWDSHDFGPLYQPDMSPDDAREYLHDPYLFAHKILGSKAKRQLISIYDISPETTGVFDLVFCGSVLLHLTDPIKALWHIQSVTREVAIIATVIHPLYTNEPLALFNGQHHGDVWWFPNRAALEEMIKSAGFTGWEWFSEFHANTRDGHQGPYHGLIRAWNTPDRPQILDHTDQPSNEISSPIKGSQSEVQHLREQVNQYESMRIIRLIRWFNSKKQAVINRLLR